MSKSETELLEEMAKWLKIMGIQEVRPLFNDIFDYEGDEKRERSAKLAYELTNGEYSTRDIAPHIDFKHYWVSDRQREWAEHGLVEKDAPTAKYSHVVSLTEIGIEVPGLDEALEELEDENDE